MHALLLLSRVRAVALLLLVTAGLLLIDVTAAVAADEQVVTDDGLRVVQTLNVVVAVFLPILVGLVTKATWSSGTRAVTLAALTVLGAFITTYINDPDAFDLFGAVLTAVVSFVTAVAAHYGLWAPTGVAEKAKASLVK